jgi:phosphate uptake regulator
MSEKFHAELKDLKQDTAEMVQFSRDMLSESVHALILQDPVMAKQVSSKKKHIKDITIILEDRTYA